MSLSGVISVIVLFAAIAAVLFLGGTLLVAKGEMPKENLKRVIVSIAVFAVIYLGSGFVINWQVYDVYVQAIEFLAAVVGAGCYWIGSNPR